MKLPAQILLPILLILTSVSVFSQDIEYSYISPLPESRYINIEQIICLKTGHAFKTGSIEKDNIQIEGSKSGPISFNIKLSDDCKVLFIKPDGKFQYNEKINIHLSGNFHTADGQKIEARQFSFYTATCSNEKICQEFYTREQYQLENHQVQSVKSVSGQDFNYENNLPPDYPPPIMNILEEPDDEYIFFTVMSKNNTIYSPYLTIWDKYGIPVYYKKMDGQTMNFYVLDNGNLVYGATEGMINSSKRYYIMNPSFVIIDTAEMGNGYNVDLHDFLVLNNGHYLMQSYDVRIIDMSEIVEGGHPAAKVTGLVIQEVDQQQNVYFQWRSWDHFEITDATPDIDLTDEYIDYCHGNTLTIDNDGQLLISCRNMDEITKINFQNGNIIWRWGKWAKNNEFTLVDDPTGFSHQHDIRVLSNGYYTVYDNGNNHFPQVSQALEYCVNEETMTATRVWYYRNNPEIYAFATGSHQRTSSNKSLIGWGWTSPLAATEVRMDGTPTFELFLPDNVIGYRTLKFAWQTNLFYMQDLLDFGSYTGDPFAISKELQITNNASHPIKITSSHNHLNEFYVNESFPLIFSAGQTKSITISFAPGSQGYYNDILTLNSDNSDNTQRIARQVGLYGFWDEVPPTVNLTPLHGSTNISVDTIVIAYFSEPVRQTGGALINSNYIQEMFYFKENDINGIDVPFYGAIDDTHQKIKLIPKNLLKEDQQYFVELIANKVEDRAGNKLDQSEISVFKTLTTVNINDSRTDQVIHIFPNPAQSHFYINMNSYTESKVKVEIFDMRGTKVLEKILAPGTRKLTVNTDYLNNGFYLVRILAHNKHLTTKILINKTE